MSRRIEVELTSARDDGSFTWRAAGAKQPKGVVEPAVLPGGAKVGDVLRAEADFDIEGVTITAILPPLEKHRNDAPRIELLGPPRRDDEPLVTSTLVPKEQRGGRDGRDRGDRSARPRRQGGDRPTGPRREGGDRAPRQGGPRADGERRDRASGDGEHASQSRGDRRPPRPRPEAPPKPKPKRLRPQRTHRSAVLDELPVEHRPIAEQVLQGDIPAVRQAIDKENEGRAAKGEAPIDGIQLIAIAERLRPRLRTAEWRDRAEAALADMEELDLRDLRSVVVGGDAAARDEATRALAAQLREGLAQRVEAEQAAWLAELNEALDGGRVVRALRLSSRPPKAGTLLRPELATKLSEAASAALTELAAPDRWAILLDAVAHSPVRLTVKPRSLPTEPPAELLAVVRRLSSRIPEIAGQLGVEVTAAPRAGGPRRAAKPARAKGERPRPPKPPRPDVAAAAPATATASGAADAPAVSPEPASTSIGSQESVAAVEPAADPTEASAPAIAREPAPASTGAPAPAAEPGSSGVQEPAAEPEPESAPTEAPAPAAEPELGSAPTEAPGPAAAPTPDPGTAPSGEGAPIAAPDPGPATAPPGAEPLAATPEPATAPPVGADGAEPILLADDSRAARHEALEPAVPEADPR